MEEGLCYVNGAFLPASEAKVSIFDRGFTSGEGVYDVTRSFGHKLFKLDEHIARLYRSLKYTRIDCGIPADEMTRLSIEVFERNKHLLDPDDDCAVWQVISRGVDRFAKGTSHTPPYAPRGTGACRLILECSHVVRRKASQVHNRIRCTECEHAEANDRKTGTIDV
jgi:branched-subunit amino acid aminotransferase/4-amino-4-deoxychorismate lyase